MNRFITAIVTVVLLGSTGGAAQAEQDPVRLPVPVMTGGAPLMDALANRSTKREFSSRELSPQVLSNLLWAAHGFNRPEEKKRTVPSARDIQEIDIYVFTSKGVYLHDAWENVLVPYMEGDNRAATGTQDYVATAPVNLVYVADYSRMGEGYTDEYKLMTSSMDTGFISQNVYLYCASEKLSTVVRGLVDREGLKTFMKLRPEQHITYTQSIGYPAE